MNLYNLLVTVSTNESNSKDRLACLRACDVEMTSPASPLAEGRRAVFRCVIRVKMARVERVSWFLDSLNLSSVENRRLMIKVENQPGDRRDELTSKLVIDPVKHSDSGTTAGAHLGFYKGGCPIHLKGAQEVERRRGRGLGKRLCLEQSA